MRLHGVEGLSYEEMYARVAAGSRFVVFEYCVSILFATLRSPSSVYLLHPDDAAWPQRLGYSAISLAFGWWGLPWGVIHTPLTVATNLAGGVDVTEAIWPGDADEWERLLALSRE